MIRFRARSSGPLLLAIWITFVLLALAQRLSASDTPGSTTDANSNATLPATNQELKVDCASGTKLASTASHTLSCPLQEGETTFVITLPKIASFDSFTFVNENSDVQGEMKIAISNNRLPAHSPEWIEVNGKTEFASKRLFNVSLIGVEARYLKLSFHVEKGSSIASAASVTN